MFTVEIHATSHVGRVRRGNEDNYLLLNISRSRAWTSEQTNGEFVIESQKFDVDENGVVLAVSDGMGGALAGEVASKMAVESVSEKLLHDEDDDATLTPEANQYNLISRLYNATVYANYLVHQQGRSDPQFQGMGATFTGIGVTPEGVDIIQVGDSRAYLIRKGKIYQVTKDQSLVQQLIDAQQISVYRTRYQRRICKSTCWTTSIILSRLVLILLRKRMRMVVRTTSRSSLLSLPAISLRSLRGMKFNLN